MKRSNSWACTILIPTTNCTKPIYKYSYLLYSPPLIPFTKMVRLVDRSSFTNTAGFVDCSSHVQIRRHFSLPPDVQILRHFSFPPHVQILRGLLFPPHGQNTVRFVHPRCRTFPFHLQIQHGLWILPQFMNKNIGFDVLYCIEWHSTMTLASNPSNVSNGILYFSHRSLH